MPKSKYIRIGIDEQELDISSAEDLPVAINYKLEDPDNFQTKSATQAFDIPIPATVKNDKIANTFHNPGVEDLTEDEIYRSNRSGFIEANGIEILVGKSFLESAKHQRTQIGYIFNFYGNNADWIIDLKDATLFDFLKQINFTFTKQRIIDSWGYDGTNENLPYVFAPVRYGLAMDDFVPVSGDNVPDRNMTPEYMRPALSKYWILFWAFKSLGYKISSQFFDTPYFRRQVMPWTWGNFLSSDGTRLDNLDFLAKSTQSVYFSGSTTQFWDLLVSNDSTTGAFDNNNVYEYDAVNKLMKWTYNPAFNYGTLQGTYHLNISVDATATANSDVELRVQWFKNGIRVPNGNDNGNGTELVNINAPAIGRRDFVGLIDQWFTCLVDPGDVISAKFYLHTFASSLGRANITAEVLAFELDYFRIPLGGLIDFQNYTAFQNYKVLDFISGIVDEFNLSVQTDPVNKVVTMEPTHDYSLDNDLSIKQGGYFNGKWLDWEKKQELSKDSDLSLYSDSERELLFKYKDDNSDGILKKVQDRYVNLLATGKYVLPDRFQISDKQTFSSGLITGGKKIENRFFAPTMHYDVAQWKGLGSDPDESPQMICIVPENVSNTSADEAQNTFEPKSVYYKGIIENVGWIFDNEAQANFPFMFAVNYKPGGEDDPVLSYSDEKIGESSGSGSGAVSVIAKGLLKRFYWQRLAIMRNGQFYTTSYKLNNIDVTNWLHREHIITRGQRWELVEIKSYKPLLEQTTECLLRKWSPITKKEADNTFPSEGNILGTSPITGSFDIKYSPLKCLSSDI